jgi:hypothetical protein
MKLQCFFLAVIWFIHGVHAADNGMNNEFFEKLYSQFRQQQHHDSLHRSLQVTDGFEPFVVNTGDAASTTFNETCGMITEHFAPYFTCECLQNTVGENLIQCSKPLVDSFDVIFMFYDASTATLQKSMECFCGNETCAIGDDCYVMTYSNITYNVTNGRVTSDVACSAMTLGAAEEECPSTSCTVCKDPWGASYYTVDLGACDGYADGCLGLHFLPAKNAMIFPPETPPPPFQPGYNASCDCEYYTMSRSFYLVITNANSHAFFFVFDFRSD